MDDDANAQVYGRTLRARTIVTGDSPFTIAAQIAALLVAADLGDTAGEMSVATYLRDTADTWNASIERWLYVTGTTLAQQHGVEGYYVRVAEPDQADAASPCDGFVPIKNRPPGISRAGLADRTRYRVIRHDARGSCRRRPDGAPRAWRPCGFHVLLAGVDPMGGHGFFVSVE